jgi:hypothetical protein
MPKANVEILVGIPLASRAWVQPMLPEVGLHRTGEDGSEGLVVVGFRFDALFGTQSLVAKGAEGVRGRLAIWLEDDRLRAEMGGHEGTPLQLRPDDPMSRERWHQAALSFGPLGTRLFLDRRLVASDERPIGLLGNDRPWILGGPGPDPIEAELHSLLIWPRQYPDTFTIELCLGEHDDDGTRPNDGFGWLPIPAPPGPPPPLPAPPDLPA